MENEKLKIGLIKRQLPFKVRKFAEYDITEIVKTLDTMEPEWWFNDDSRQRGKVHTNTHALDIFWNIECLKDGKRGKKNERNYDFLNFKKILEDLKPIYESEFGKGTFHRVLIARLKPNASVNPHSDTGAPLMKGRRTHIPLVTSEKIAFKVGKDQESFYLKAGSIYELNNAKKHAVDNPTDEYRTHLIIDWLEEKGFWLKNE